jgi:uncharacterized membrane protein
LSRLDGGWTEERSGVTTNRLEAFNDGVLAIIITIMVLELKPPALVCRSSAG